jgi:hypothetical protein
MNGCGIGTEYYILHAKEDQLHPSTFTSTNLVSTSMNLPRISLVKGLVKTGLVCPAPLVCQCVAGCRCGNGGRVPVCLPACLPADVCPSSRWVLQAASVEIELLNVVTGSSQLTGALQAEGLNVQAALLTFSSSGLVPPSPVQGGATGSLGAA